MSYCYFFTAKAAKGRKVYFSLAFFSALGGELFFFRFLPRRPQSGAKGKAEVFLALLGVLGGELFFFFTAKGAKGRKE